MNPPRACMQSSYMEFAKLKSEAKYSLAGSGLMNCSIFDLHFHLDDLDINGPIYGCEPLREAIAGLKGVVPESVFPTAGTSMANHLVMAALLSPGDEVLIEEPTYELLLSTALYLGAKVRRFQRRVEDDYAVDPEEVARNLTPQTRLIVIANLQNPTSALVSQESLRAVGDLANQIGARVLVDEVYLETLHRPAVPTAFLLGNQFVVTSSLTKAYGLGGLRSGWVLAEPELATRISRLNDLFAAYNVHIGDLFSVIAIEQIDKLAKRADAIVDANRASFREILGGHPAIEMSIPEVGNTVFPRLRQGNVEGFFDFLRERYETSFVPGVYFERPEHFRIGFAADVEKTREGFRRLAEALHVWKG